MTALYYGRVFSTRSARSKNNYWTNIDISADFHYFLNNDAIYLDKVDTWCWIGSVSFPTGNVEDFAYFILGQKQGTLNDRCT